MKFSSLCAKPATIWSDWNTKTHKKSPLCVAELENRAKQLSQAPNGWVKAEPWASEISAPGQCEQMH